MITKALIFECDAVGCDSTHTLQHTGEMPVEGNGWIEIDPRPDLSAYGNTRRRCICPKHAVLKP